MLLSASVMGPILVGALLCLDRNVVGPFMVGRPLMVGFLIGALTGQTFYGTWMGLSVELLWLAAIPLGGQLIPHAGPAVAAAFIAWVGSGFGPQAGAFQTEAGLVLSFLTVPLWAQAFTLIDKACRGLAPRRLAAIRADLEAGREPRLFRRNLAGLWWALAFSLVAITVAVAVNSQLLGLMARWAAAAGIVFVNLGFLFTFIPFLGLLGMAVGSLESKNVMIYFAGLLVGLLVLSAVK
ncbi:MAG: PTS sugar transporter subunit IIC [Candidatus Adiutrix sp.]|jgi:mannose/fructose/N-acetylgalactosamine-specific phosphotransferase system component IIC|nr:PTS sugar transporter subunit IIC [Candidatus Adiutrix sp.]